MSDASKIDQQFVIGANGPPDVKSVAAAVDKDVAIVKAIILGDGAAPSQQIKPDSTNNTIDIVSDSQIIIPPVDLDYLAACLDASSRLSRCIRTYARNTFGFGWEIVPKDPINEDTPPEVLAKIGEQTKALRRVFNRPNTKMSFTKIGELVCIDEEAVGNGYIEIVRNAAGAISSLYHVPGRTIRILKGGVGYVQIREGKIKYFRNFGDTLPMDSDTGERRTSVAKNKRASELLPFKIDSVRSSWYGVPRWYPTIPEIAGNKYAAMRNVSFFENDACPRLLITVVGGKLLPDSVAVMRQFFELRGKGAANAHRVCVLQAEPRRPGAGPDSSKVMINVEKLTVGIEDEASFQKYQAANDERIREAFGIAKIFFAPSGSNRANAIIERQITNEQEFEPARVDKEYCMDNSICLDILSGGLHAESLDSEDVLVQFRLKRPRMTYPSEQAEIHRKYAAAGVLTPNEIRQQLGHPPFSEEHIFANKPVSIALTELQISPAMARAGLRPLVGEFIDQPGEESDGEQQPNSPVGKAISLTKEEVAQMKEMKEFLESRLGCDVVLNFDSILGSGD